MSPGRQASLRRGGFTIIPAIDLIEGRAVRLHQGDYATAEVVAEDPVETARAFAAAGARRLHVVDLSGARSGRPEHGELIARLVAAVPVPVQVGGGLRRGEDARRLLGAGAAQIILGTAALEDPALLVALSAEHPGRILVGLDARGGRVALRGWMKEAEEDLTAAAARVAALPIAGIVYTDIARDGTGRGPNAERTAALARALPQVPVVASGGVGSLDHLAQLSERAAEGVVGVIVGKALYQGTVSLQEALGRFDRPAPGLEPPP